MNVKIKSSGVSCLIGDDYDRVYTALKKQFEQDSDNLFTERTPGHEYLQWELPGDGWVALSTSDPLMSQEVKKELLHRKQNICEKFGNNQEMAQKVLSVPDYSYVYYKHDDAGRLIIRLTAWGYRYPERVGGGDATTDVKPKDQTEHVSISLIYDGEPLPGKSLRLNGFLRMTDANGLLDVGDLPIGYQFDIEVEKRQQHITVMQGQGEIIIDLAKYTNIEIQAILNNAPYSGAQVVLSYVGRNMQLTCDNNGRATTKLPLAKDGSLCTVTIDNSTQQESLKDSTNTFIFQLTSPQLKEKIIDIPPKNVHHKTGDDIIVPKNTTVTIKVTLDDMPYSGVQVILSYVEKQIQLICDGNGNVTTQLPLNKENNICKITVEEQIQQEPLKEGINTFEFHLKSKVIVPPIPPIPPVNDKIRKTPWWIYLLETFAALSLAYLIYLTFVFCGGLFFG